MQDDDGAGDLRDVYPRPPRGGRLRIPQPLVIGNTISIHALREEGDVVTVVEPHLNQRFLSTPSARRATWQLLRLPDHRSISIHALREEGDVRSVTFTRSCAYFYPRPPRGGRPASPRPLPRMESAFLSTPSARRATFNPPNLMLGRTYFYPRPPRGGRLDAGACNQDQGYFYPRPPRGGRPRATVRHCWVAYFYPRPPRGGRPWTT